MIEPLVLDTIREIVGSGHADLAAALNELGFAEVIEEDEAAASIALLTECGWALAGSNALDYLIARALGVELSSTTAVLHPRPGSSWPPRTDDPVGLGLGGWTDVENVIAVLDTPDGAQWKTIPRRRLTVAPISGLDPDLRLVQVSGAEAIEAIAGTPVDPPAIRALAHRALAAEMTGVAQAALNLAADHVRVRQQFGQAIGSFQAVRHRLAEGWAYVSGAEALTAAAFETRSDSLSAMAKVWTGRAVELTTRHVLQVCGAIGLTDEFTLHRYVRRMQLLDLLWGSGEELAEETGRALLDQDFSSDLLSPQHLITV